MHGTLTAGESVEGMYGKVYLDNIPQKDCVEANWLKGWIIRYKRDADGKIIANAEGKTETEKVFGKVCIILETPNAP